MESTKSRGPLTSVDNSTGDNMDLEPPSMAMVGGIEERGRSTNKHRKNEKRTEWVLGKKVPRIRKGKEDLPIEPTLNLLRQGL